MSQTQALEIVRIPVGRIRPSPYQPRLAFDLEELRGSIQKYGIRDPLKVRKIGDYYELIDGERRWRIAEQESIKTVPCLVLEYTDEEADALAWRFNTERKDYSLEEKAKHFKKHQSAGMSARGIANIHGINHVEVSRLLAIFRLPEKYQNYIWTGEFSAVNYRYLHEKGLMDSESVTMVTQIIDESVERRLTQREFEKVVDDYIGELERKQVDEAKKAAAKLEASRVRETSATEAIGKPEVTPPETAEEFEKAAKALKKRAKELKTPEQILEEKREKARNALVKGKLSLLFWVERAKKMRIDTTEFEKRIEGIKAKIVNAPDEAIKETKQLKADIDKAIKNFEEEERKRNIEEEAEKRAKELEEAEKRRIEEEARAKARKELLKDTEFIREFIAKEYPLIHETLDVEDLRGLLMQRLMANIPEEKKERAEKIFKEEWGSLEKRIKMFPEKSAMMEPKFDRLRQLEEEGVFLTTLWDIGERADYAGEGDFHGNCPPQVVENCILLKTKKGELVVDPMAGSGTALDACKLLGRRCIAYDIKPPKQRNDIIKNDSRKIPLEDSIADMVFLHPPYWDMVYYTSADERLADLSRAKTLDEYLDMLEKVLRECYRTLKNGRYLCILLGDRIKDGRFVPLCRKTANLAEKIGFIDCGYAIKFTKGSTSLVVKGKTIYAELAYAEKLPKINHDLVMFFRKE